MLNLKYLCLNVSLMPEQNANDAISNVAFSWDRVIRQLYNMQLEYLKITLVCCVGQRGQATWAIPVQDSAEYALPELRGRVINEGWSLSCELYDATPKQVFDLFRVNLSQI